MKNAISRTLSARIASARIACALSLAVLGMASAAAFTMEPMSVLLAPSGTGSIATFRLSNDGTERIAVKVSVLTRAVAADGSELNTPADELFVVYPARLLLEPGSQASIKLQWKGPTVLQAERSFRLLAEQVPLDQGIAASSGIRVMFRYIASLYVGDSRFAPDLRATVKGTTGPDGKRGFLVAVSNAGSRHVVAEGLSVTLAAASGTALSLPAASLGGLSGANYLAGSSRSLFVPDERAEPGKVYEARLAYEALY